jgi:Protein of unknown function (DUF3467)
VTTNPAGDQPPLHFEMTIADTLAAGVYANFLGVWHTAHEFTLDFAVTQPASLAQTPDGDNVTRVPCQVVARVKVPPTVLFDFLRTVNDNLATWERNFGGVHDQ